MPAAIFVVTLRPSVNDIAAVLLIESPTLIAPFIIPPIAPPAPNANPEAAPSTLTAPSNENLPIVETTSDDNSNAAYKTLFN